MTGGVYGFGRGADASRLGLGHDVVRYLWYLNEPQAPPPGPTLFLASRSGSISNVVSEQVIVMRTRRTPRPFRGLVRDLPRMAGQGCA